MTTPGESGGGPRKTFPPYGPEDVASIKAAIEAGEDLSCPACGGPLAVHPFDMLGTPGEDAYEIQCVPCRRFLVVRDRPRTS